ncbi:MAG: alpha/beta fold hydrolase [Lysobacteraceae bacterium]
MSLTAFGAAAQALPERADPTTTAIALLDHLDAGRFEQAESQFTEQMADAVPVERLQAVWEALPQQAGPASGRGEATTATQNGMTLVKIPLHYAQAELIASVAVDAQGRVTGFLIQPAPPKAAAAPASDAPFTESEASVGGGETALPATLAMPRAANTANQVPGVVLVHGSGAQDRDETIGPNRVFLDIARGLAAQGIAVLRYEKRSKARPQDFSGEFTVDDETTNDAVTALATLAAIPGVDAKRIYVLGHSQGGMMAPRILAQAPEAAGAILFAAPARSLLDILIEQNQRLAAMDGDTSDDEKAAIAVLQQQVAAVRKGGDVPLEQTPMRQPAAYWRSIDSVDPVAEARDLEQPMLMLQGGRDIQVVDADWQLWLGAYENDPRFTFKHYPALNHLGIAGEGPGTLTEYQKPGHVDAQLIDDVAAWIKTLAD